MNLAVCEDNEVLAKQYAEAATAILEEEGHTCTVDIFLTVQQLMCSDRNYDLLLLDCELPDGNGISTAKILHKKTPDTCIIIITAYEQYVFESFEAETFRYLLKPLDEDKFRKAILAFLDRCRSGALVSVTTPDKTVLYIKISDIIYAEASGKKTKLRVGNEILIALNSISEIEERLKEYPFFRTHRSYIVNLAQVDRISQNTVLMRNGDEIYISRRCKTAFNEKMNKWLRDTF